MSHMHPIFQRLCSDMAAAGLLPDTEQRAGETLAPTADLSFASAREATPIPHLSGHTGQEL